MHAISLLKKKKPTNNAPNNTSISYLLTDTSRYRNQGRTSQSDFLVPMYLLERHLLLMTLQAIVILNRKYPRIRPQVHPCSNQALWCRKSHPYPPKQQRSNIFLRESSAKSGEGTETEPVLELQTRRPLNPPRFALNG